MPEPFVIFYSWQSDTPSNVNRSFIEKALREAAKRLTLSATFEEAPRDVEPASKQRAIEIDRDTRGTPGSPPLTDTILKKVQACNAFVADLTFVGSSLDDLRQASELTKRYFPNPNVLLEYGYALRCHGYDRVIGVMNTAFGAPPSGNLPFDLNHLRWPICYELALSTPDDTRKQLDALAKALVRALRDIMAIPVPDKEPPLVDQIYYDMHEASIKEEVAKLFDKEKRSLWSIGPYVSKDMVGTKARHFLIACEVDKLDRYSFALMNFTHPNYPRHMPLVPLHGFDNKDYFAGILPFPEDPPANEVKIEIVFKFTYGRYQARAARLSDVAIGEDAWKRIFGHGTMQSYLCDAHDVPN